MKQSPPKPAKRFRGALPPAPISFVGRCRVACQRESDLDIDEVIDQPAHASCGDAGVDARLDPVLTADLPVTGGSDGHGRPKAQVKIYARGIKDGGASVNITYPGMIVARQAVKFRL